MWNLGDTCLSSSFAKWRNLEYLRWGHGVWAGVCRFRSFSR